MMKSSTSFGFSSSLLFFFFFIVASIAVYSEAAGDCVYKLIVQTGTVAEAGTQSNIGVTFGNNVGESVEIPYLMAWGSMRSGDDYFNSGSEDLFLVPALCISTSTPVCKITVTSDGEGQKPGWYLKYVSVSNTGTNADGSPHIDTQFGFNQWLAIDESPYELTASRDVCQ